MLLSVIREPAPNPLPEGVKPPGLGPRKRANAAHDMRHWAELCGAEFAQGRGVRSKVNLLTQAAWVAKDENRYREFHYPAFRARWADGVDVSDPEVVGKLLAGAGLDGDAALQKAQSDVYQERVEKESKDAIERGVFGAHTLFVGDEMFWGNDRFELVRYYIQKAQT